VLSERGRRFRGHGRHVRQFDRVAGHLDATLGRRDVDQHLPGGELRVLQDLLDRPDAAARHARRMQPIEQRVDPFIGEARPDDLVQRLAVLQPIVVGGEARIVLQMLETHRAAEPRPQPRIRHGDDHVAVGGRVGFVGSQRGMFVAEASGTLAGRGDDSDRKAEDGHRGIEERDVDELSLARPLPLNVRQQDPLDGIQRREAIGDRHADLGRAGLREPGDVHQPRLTLDHHVVAGFVPARPGGAVAGNRTVDQPRVQLARAIRTESEPLERARPEVLDHHVGGAEKLREERPSVGRLEIDRHALLVAIDAEEVRAPAADERAPGSRIVAVPRILDLDHLGTHVAQQHGAEGTGEHAGEVDDLEAAQRQLGGLLRGH
jgi:hypothetical protein